MGPFFGELYLRSTRPFLDPRVTRLEAEFIATALQLLPDDRVIDLCSGHGRHLEHLRGAGYRAWGLELDARSLTEAPRLARAVSVRGDLYRLPFFASFDAAYSWYASLYLSPDAAVNQAALREAAAALRPGGRLLVHSHNPLAQAREGKSHFATVLEDGSPLVEDTWFVASEGMLRGRRTLTLPDRVLEGEFAVRCPTLEDHRCWGAAAGLTVEATWGDIHASPPSEATPDLIVLLRKR